MLNFALAVLQKGYFIAQLTKISTGDFTWSDIISLRRLFWAVCLRICKLRCHALSKDLSESENKEGYNSLYTVTHQIALNSVWRYLFSFKFDSFGYRPSLKPAKLCVTIYSKNSAWRFALNLTDCRLRWRTYILTVWLKVVQAVSIFFVHMVPQMNPMQGETKR